MSLCGAQKVEFIGKPNARLHIVAPVHVVKCLRWDEGWNPSEGEGYGAGGVVKIGTTTSTGNEAGIEKAVMGTDMFKVPPVMSFKYETKTRCHKSQFFPFPFLHNSLLSYLYS